MPAMALLLAMSLLLDTVLLPVMAFLLATALLLVIVLLLATALLLVMALLLATALLPVMSRLLDMTLLLVMALLLTAALLPTFSYTRLDYPWWFYLLQSFWPTFLTLNTTLDYHRWGFFPSLLSPPPKVPFSVLLVFC